MQKKTKKIFIFAIVLSAIFLAYFSGASKMFTFENFKTHRAFLLEFVNKNYFLAVLSYLLIYILIVISTLPLAGSLTIISGFLFDVIPGTIYSVIAGTVGSLLAFLIYRYIFGATIRKRYSNKLEYFNKKFTRFGGWYIFLIQIIGIVPFFIINALSSLTTISVKKFSIATFFGIIPISFLYAYSGKQLGHVQQLNQIVSTKFILAIVFVIVLLILPIIFKKNKLMDH